MKRTRILTLLTAFVLASSCEKEKATAPPVSLPPHRPDWLSVLSVTHNSVTLRWSYPYDDELGFILYYMRPDLVWRVADSLAADVVETTARNLQPGTNYLFRLTAYNSHGESLPSNEAPARTSGLPAPMPPDSLRIVAATDTSLTLAWLDRSTDPPELGFIVERREGTQWLIEDTAAANQTQDTIGGLQPGSAYSFRVLAFNANGNSEPSNVATGSTTGTFRPQAPTGVTATALGEYTVRVTWADRARQDSFVVQRRAGTGPWERIGAVPDNTTQFTDSTVVPQLPHFFRVGAKVDTMIAWSDGVGATTSLNAPQDLVAIVERGRGVVLTWTDRSAREERFDIGRNRTGEPLGIRSTVPANVTTYTDSLGDSTGVFFYRVRAANAYGASGWALSNQVEYNYCSDGVIPLCVDNWWEYEMDSAGTMRTFRVLVKQPLFVNGEDFYPMARFNTGPWDEDTLHYLRNYSGSGCFALPHPLPSDSIPDLLFPYPAAVGAYTFVEQDCVLVAGRNLTMRVGSTLYTGVYLYQRFFNRQRQHMLHYYVKPLTVGIIREVELVGTQPPDTVALRDIVRYYVQN